MKKILSTLLCLVFVFTFIASGCGSSTAADQQASSAASSDNASSKPSDTTAAKAGEQTVVQYWDTVNDADPNDYMNQWTKDNIDLFQQQNPNIKIQFTNTANGDQYLNKISTEMAANNAPDVFMTWVAGRLEPFVKAGRLLPLDDIINGDANLKDVINPGNLTPTTFNGKVYAIPNELAGETVFYNKAIFQKYSLQVPKTWDELLNVIKVLKQNGVVPFALANKDPWPGTIPFMAIFDRINGPEEIKKTTVDKQAVFNTDAYKKSAEYFAQLVKAGAFADNFNSLDGNEGTTMFKNGKAAMDFNGTWNIPGYVQGLGDNLGTFNWVDMPDGKGSSNDDWLLLQNHAFSIGANTKVKDAAGKFLAFIFSKDRQKVLAEKGYVVASKNIPFDESKLNPAAAQIAKSLASAKNPILIWDVLLGNNIGKELNLSTQAILGGADIQKTLDKLNSVAKSEWNQ